MTLDADTWEYRFLTRIADAGGSISWVDLTHGDCTLGTRLERRGLCHWRNTKDVKSRKRFDMKSILTITPEGLAAIGRDAA